MSERGGSPPDTPHRAAGCPDMIDELLDADPAVLAGGGRPDADGALVRHLRTCDGCARAAAILLEASEALDRGLEQPGPAVDAAAIVRRGRARRTAAVRDRSRWTVAGLLAAAAVAGLLLVPREPQPPGVGERPAAPSPSPGLDLVASRDVAVLSGTDPDITILWFFDAEGGAP